MIGCNGITALYISIFKKNPRVLVKTYLAYMLTKLMINLC